MQTVIFRNIFDCKVMYWGPGHLFQFCTTQKIANFRNVFPESGKICWFQVFQALMSEILT